MDMLVIHKSRSMCCLFKQANILNQGGQADGQMTQKWSLSTSLLYKQLGTQIHGNKNDKSYCKSSPTSFSTLPSLEEGSAGDGSKSSSQFSSLTCWSVPLFPLPSCSLSVNAQMLYTSTYFCRKRGRFQVALFYIIHVL